MLDATNVNRQPGATFALGDILWADFESKSRVPINAGTDKYACHAQAILLAWAIGDGPVHIQSVHDFTSTLRWVNMPAELVAFFARVDRGEAVICAFNAGFDRAIWNLSTDGFPWLEPWMVIDAKVQAMASGLPASLDGAVRAAGGHFQKDKLGKELIKLFTLPDSTATPQSHVQEWINFCTYAKADVLAMRDLFKRTRQLPLAEWEEYWCAESINDRGVAIDLPFVKAAANMAAIDQRRSGYELDQLTDGAVTTVNQVARMIAWLNAVLPADGREMLIKRDEVVDLDSGEILKPTKNSLERDRVIRLITYLEAHKPLPAPLAAALRVLQIRRYGGSKTPAKFSKMLSQHVGGVLRGQYVFGGASQTGRFSAKGVQIHNLARDTLTYEVDAIDALTGGMAADDFAEYGDTTPISRKLSLLIRPALVPDSGKIFCWGDWSNIEARLVPWLAADPEAEKRLDIFRAVDDGSEPFDIYTRTAARLSGLPLIEAKESKVRQRGKVVELACGFGGSTNALLSMAASYGIHLDSDVAKAFVEQWRNENGWAVRFWGKHTDHQSYGLWGALNSALETPGIFFEAGRVGYVFLEPYLGGSLLCRLPSGRWLTYRKLRWENVDVLDDDGNRIDVKRELMFSRNEGRVKLWPGLACENVVQATAADILRGTLVRLDGQLYSDMPVRLHTHDEVLIETEEMVAQEAALLLRNIMQQGFTWSIGLPIAAETVCGRWYSKAKGSIGL